MSTVPYGLFGEKKTIKYKPFPLDQHDIIGIPVESLPELRPEQSYFPKEITSFIDANVEKTETQGEHVYRLELQRLKKEEVKVEIVEKGGVLRISGERKIERTRELFRGTRCRDECKSGEFLRCFRLPENAKASETTALLEDGVLTVNVPKHRKTTWW